MPYGRVTLVEPALRVDKRHGVDGPQFLAEREPTRRRFIRHRAVIFAILRLETRESVDPLGTSRRAVQAWVARSNAEGVHGLTAHPQSGRPSLLSAEQLETLRQATAGGPFPVDRKCTLHDPEIRDPIERDPRQEEPHMIINWSLRGLPRNRPGEGSAHAQPRNRND